MIFIKYISLLVLLFMFSNGKYIPNDFQYRITDGRPVEADRLYPVVSIQHLDYSNKRRHICGGSIIKSNQILSAAHCFKPKPYNKIIIAVVGIIDISTEISSDLIYTIEKVITHNKYDPLTFSNDIALLYTKGIISDNIVNQTKIALQHKNIKAGLECDIMGWGRTRYKGPRTNILLRAEIRIFYMATCYSPFQAFFRRVKTDGMICAGTNTGINICQGDSGGPLICNNFLTGIVSHTWGCGKRPSVYTKVSEYYGWILRGRSNRINSYNIFLEFYLVIFFLIV